MSETLEFDGERFTPENVREIWYEHMHRYVFACQFVEGLEVLDAACGEGYGSDILARVARSVDGVDVSSRAIDHARRRYRTDNLRFHQADCADLPFEDDRFDSIVSFETIEHLEDQEGMLAEFSRVLRPAGFLLISSPDKAVYSDEQGFDNPHHVRELYRDEFRALLEARFPVCRMFGQKLLFHSAIWNLDQPLGDREVDARRLRLQQLSDGGPVSLGAPVQRPMYLLAICAQSEEALPPMERAAWLFDDREESVYRHYQHEIRKNMQAGSILAERDEELGRLSRELEAERSRQPNRPSWLNRLGLFRRSRK